MQDEQVIETACKRDCGRAACNRILDELRTQAMASDPSDGKCDPLPGDFKTDCRNRVKGSLESWIAQIEANYEQCVAAAVYNDNPSLPYTEHDSAFAEEGKLVFDDWGCNKDLAGCLYGAELRPFCKIDDFTEGDSCQQAENPIDQEATGDGGVVDSSSGGGVVDPFGDVGTLVSCSPQTTCTIEQELISNVQTNFNVFYDEGVELTLGTYGTGVTGLEISGLDAGDYAKELFDEFGVYNDDVITHVNGTALDSGEDVWDVIAAMDSVSQWNITVRRPRGGSYLTYNYTIALPVSIEAGPQERNGGGTSGADAGGQNDGRGCGCSQTGKGKYAAFGTLLLFGLTGRRRRRATQA